MKEGTILENLARTNAGFCQMSLTTGSFLSKGVKCKAISIVMGLEIVGLISLGKLCNIFCLIFKDQKFKRYSKKMMSGREKVCLGNSLNKSSYF